MQWRPFNLCEQQVGRNPNLLVLLLDLLELQEHSQQVLPVLCDENIHYRLLRLMYLAPLQGWDVGRLLSRVPLVYGVWHGYKHTLTVMYRAFFPLLANLECTGAPVVGSRLCGKRRIVTMEKMVACLLLARPRVQDRLQQHITQLQAQGANQSRISPTR